ncbi:hypothetical protein [Paeniglutamicibacter sp. NPDC091659]|uniref:hypothetical protein n=1 Tax=Paeniglutamicibacter sp. NPDC091659 TaxID=3364389 RepID=UPI0038038BF9
MTDVIEPIKVRVHALSISDALGYRAQQAVAQAVADRGDYRIIGGHMVRMLLHVYPTANAVLRSTADADAALGSVEVLEPVTQNLVAANFTKEGGNILFKDVGAEQRIEINLLLARTGAAQGLRAQSVPGVGQIDTLPELRFALMTPALVIDVEAHLDDTEAIEYQTRIPNLEAAAVLKAHSWKDRGSEKDLADLHSLLEIRDAHPSTEWLLGDPDPIGFRKDTARILKDLAGKVTRKNAGFPVPGYLNRIRFAALISRHIA